jgi:hypothetical protein
MMERRFQKTRIFFMGRLVSGEFECVNPNAMDGFFIIAPAGATHRKPTLWNPPHHGFHDLAVP